jgi:hypothetical protein
MQTGGYARAREWALTGKALAHLREHRHLRIGPVDPSLTALCLGGHRLAATAS